MFQQSESNNNLPRNYLQFHENAFVSPLNLINVTHAAPFSFGRSPHFLQQKIPRTDPSALPQLQSIDTNKMDMYQFLAQRKLKEDRRKTEITQNKPTYQQRNVRSAQPQQRSKSVSTRPTSAPKKTSNFSKEPKISPRPIHFIRPNINDKQNEINDIHDQLLVQLRVLHNPSSRENIIDETEQEKQRRLRLKRERIRRDSRAIYNAHQELKQILQDIHQPDTNLPRLTHRHLNAYKTILTAVETLANEAPLKPKDVQTQQLLTAIIPVLETLMNVNQAFGLSQLHINPEFLQIPSAKIKNQRTISEHRLSPSSQLLPSIYNELMKKKQRKPRTIPSVLRPRSAESIRLPRTDLTTVTRPTISAQKKTRARSHSPLPSLRSNSTIETSFYSRYSVDYILGKLAPRLLANYTGQELSQQIERARTLIPMFLVDNKLNDDEIVGRVIQLLMPRQNQQNLSSTTKFEVFETPEERARRNDIDVCQTQISTWEDEMSQIRQRIQNYKTNRLEQETTTRRTVKFQLDSSPISTTELPENVQIHNPLYEYTLEDFPIKSNEKAFQPSSTRRNIHLNGLDSSKIRQIERYRKDYQSYLQRIEFVKNKDFSPPDVINRLAEFLLDEALLSVVNEVELLTVEMSQKLVENELLGREISLADVGKHQPKLQPQSQQQYRRPMQRIDRKQSSISPSPPIEQYNTSSFEEDLNTESKISHSDVNENIPRRKSPMGGTGRFTTTTTAFEQRKVPFHQLSASSSSSSSSTHSEDGVFIKPAVVVKKPIVKIEDDNQYSDQDFESSISSKSKELHQPLRQQSTGDEEDEDLILSTKTGEKIYSTDFEESKSKIRRKNDSDDDDDDDVSDTMKSSARSLNSQQHVPFYNDDDDDDDDD